MINDRKNASVGVSSVSSIAATEVHDSAVQEITSPATSQPITDTSEAVKLALHKHMTEQSKLELFDSNPKYALYDVNGDGINELFISYHNMMSIGSDIYIYKNGEYTKSFNFYEGANICLSEHLLKDMTYGGGMMTKIFIIADNEVLQKDELSFLNDGSTYYHNDLQILESEYNKAISKYDAMEWIHVPDSSRPVSELIDTSSY